MNIKHISIGDRVNVSGFLPEYSAGTVKEIVRRRHGFDRVLVERDNGGDTWSTAHELTPIR